MMSSIVGDNNKIDYEKAKDIFKNPQIKAVVKDSLGEKGVKFFEKLEGYGKNITENLNTFKNKDPGVFKEFLDKYLGSKAKYLLFAVAPKTAAVSIVGEMAAKRVQRMILFRSLNSPEATKLISELGSKNIPVERTKRLLKQLGQFSSKLERDIEE
jgi:hypothetical protein